MNNSTEAPLRRDRGGAPVQVQASDPATTEAPRRGALAPPQSPQSDAPAEAFHDPKNSKPNPPQSIDGGHDSNSGADRCSGKTRYATSQKAQQAIKRLRYDQGRPIRVRDVWHCQVCRGVHFEINSGGAAA